uniref:Uncharacterized protein n=1 Tax=Oryza rufipogon TaxID=4529 RepID=A0A0E0MTQ4_ORYRU
MLCDAVAASLIGESLVATQKYKEIMELERSRDAWSDVRHAKAPGRPGLERIICIAAQGRKRRMGPGVCASWSVPGHNVVCRAHALS